MVQRPAVFVGVVAADVAALADAGKVTIGVTGLAGFASVGCATQPAGAHIPGLPDLSGDIDEYGGGGSTVNRVRLLVLIQGIAEPGVLGMTSMNVEGIMPRSVQICIVEVVCIDLGSDWTSIR